MLTLFVLFCSMWSWQGAKADVGRSDSESWKYSYNDIYWDKASGCIHYKVRYWQNWGSSQTRWFCGWYYDADSENNGLTLTQYSSTTQNWYIDCEEEGDVRSNNTGGNRWDDDGRTYDEYYIIWDYPVEEKDLNTKVVFKFKGCWWRYGKGSADDEIDEEHDVYVDCKMGKYTVNDEKDVQYCDYTYTDKDGTIMTVPAIKVHWEHDRPTQESKWCHELGLWDNSGKCKLDDLKRGSLSPSEKSGDIYFEVDNNFLISSKSFYIHQQYNPTKNSNLKYTTNSDWINISAFPQVNELTVTPDVNDKQLVLKWKIPQVSSTDKNVEGCPFLVVIKNINTGEEIRDTVNYSQTQGEYEKTFKVGEIDSTTFEIQVGRDKAYNYPSWKEYFVKKSTVTINTNHCYPDGANIEKTTTIDGEDCIRISWNQTGSLWTKGTDFVINRTNLSTSTPSSFHLSEEDYKKNEYVDKLIQQCQKYKYEIIYTPGGDYEKKVIDFPTPLTTIHVESLKDLKVSKGYYSDKVDLSWKSTGEFDEFVVERRENDNEMSNYKKIQSIGGLNISDYTVEDRSCQPGIVYAYRVYGLKKCSDSKYSSKDTLYGYGFRTPTGNIYGRVAFENGQAEKDVEVRLENGEGLQSYALRFNGTGTAETTTQSVLKSGYPLTMQMWVNPDAISSDTMTLINVANYYELQLIDGSVSFKIGDTYVSSDMKLSAGYSHISAVVANDSTIRIYLNGKLLVERNDLSFENVGNSESIVFGKNYTGIIDEVRLWSRALGSNEITRDYTRYLVGNEDNLDAYYTFDFMSKDEFYDLSHRGTAYNENTGIMKGAQKTLSTLSVDQLGYRGYTNDDGQYAINGVPYYGNGTSYTITPRLGTHQFSPKQEVRFISGDAQSHTINFTDNSSFEWTGHVYYSGGTFPVEGVSFRIDGVPAMNKSGNYIMSDETGEFTISIPVGIHEVRAEKNGHKFELEGRICDSEGKDLNYQEDNNGIVLFDETKVKYIGRICGGEVEESKPVGFSLSKNNLADDMKIVLSPTNTRNYDLRAIPEKDTVSHCILSVDRWKGDTTKANKTICDYNQKDVTIHVNNETGEFVAMVYPIEYKVSLNVNGHKDISGDNSVLDLSKYVTDQYETYEYEAVVPKAGGGDTTIKFVDSVSYKQKQIFCKRYRAKMDLIQISDLGTELDYFGDKDYLSTNLNGDVSTVPLYVDSLSAYTFGLPVFITNKEYKMRYRIFEEYPYYVSSDRIDPERTDRVVINNASVSFGNKMAYSQSIDTVQKIYGFKVNEPEMTTAKGNISATFTYGDSQNPTSVSLESPMGNANGEAYVFGSHQTGTDFVTGGPDKFLCVLRDPPGSNSYSYLEKGTSFTQQSTYTGSFKQEGDESWSTGYTSQTLQISTAGVGTQQGTANLLVASDSKIKAGIVHEEEYTGSNSKSTTVTITNRIQTSDDPIYDGADGDVYVGYSTNISFGTTYDVTAIPMSTYNKLGGDNHFETTYAKSDSFAIVKQKGICAVECFNTLFAYPQIYVEQTLLPNLIDLRRSLLLPKESVDMDKMQERANKDKQNYYVSLVPEGHPDYAVPEKGYKVFYFYANKDSVKCDTINYLSQAIRKWEKALSDNDSVKVNAETLMQNYSFHAGSNVEYSEAYASNLSSSHSFSVMLGVSLNNDYEVDVLGIHSKFEYDEKFTTTQGGEFSDEAEASHTKGFVLAEDGDDDYLTVDVLYEKPDFDETYFGSGVGAGSADTSKLIKKNNYPSFVFRTRGGATSCPYEGELKSKHWKKDTSKVINVATMKLEDPKINMPVKFIENVPSGEEAHLTVYMMNNSETGEDQWFDLRFVDARNPYGAVPSIDGNSMSGFALEYLVPAGQVLEKTITITKGTVLNYDSLAIALCSKCQADPTGFLEVISDTVYFDVHFIPSCSDVAITYPTNNWTYNTNCAKDTIEGVEKHYMTVTISDFDVNYSDFEHIELQYKESSKSDDKWLTLAYYYKDTAMANKSKANGRNAFAISNDAAGKLYYKFYMDELPDQKYDLRAVSFCNINNELVENPSPTVSGIKDMYNPRLFGSPKPANGVLTVEDDIRIDFNETIADGVLTVNNFEVTGIRNGAVSDHSVSVSLDGENDYLTTEVERNFADKDLTFECWVNFDSLQNATFFSHGDAAKSISMGMNKEGKIVVKVGGKEIVSDNAPAWEKSSWNHVALVYNNVDKTLTAYVNFLEVISGVKADAYDGIGLVQVGRNVASTANSYFKGKVDQFRIWNEVRSSSTIQVNSTSQLSGNDLNLIAYYEMEEAKGFATEDKARGANLIMKGGTWALPEGRSAEFDGASYVSMNSSQAVITPAMDFTLEFWFNAKPGSTNQTLISNGTGLASNAEDASKLLRIGFDQPNVLTFCHNGYVTPVDGNFADNNWHNFTLAVNRSSGIARIYVDGELNTYFSADKISGIASDKLFVGARLYYVANDTSAAEKKREADQYFIGRIDEVRLWNLYRQQSQVENFYNQKVNGDEMGLLLYYPFEHYTEWQGIQELQFTLDDKGNDMVDDKGNKVVFATSVGEVQGSKDIPSVKNKGEVSKILYDWVVNDDALIITLQEQDYRIEKTIVNFTVNQVQDVNGNYIVSPITWSAYIDRNQLKWMDDAVTVNKKQNEPYKFEMPIVNKGGSVINYSMKNMPSWLSASPESGAINPLEKQTIEFEIDPSLAVGTYDEVVYLTNSNNVTEPLALNVTVEGDTPEWSVDPSKYEFSMAVFAQIKLDNQFSNDEKDMLAAFYNGECVGVANMSYDKTMDMWYAMMTVYSNSNSHDLVYRAWDASKGVMMAAVSSPVVPFKADTVYGKPTAPVVFYNGTTKYQNIPLSKGWNWVSFNLENKAGMSDLTAYLNGGRWGSNSIVKDLSGHSANYSVDSRKWSNDSLVLNNTSMFKIYSDENQVLSVSGKDINLDSMLIPVKAGSWNYIAYLPAGSMTLKAALAGYEAKEGDIIKSNEGFAMYYGNEWIGSLNSLQPNCGYMLKNTGDVQKTFKYPSSSSALRSAVSVASSAYESNMSIIASAPEKREGDVLRALVGTAENKIVEVSLSDDRALQFINVSAKSGDKVRFTMERDGVVYEANNALSFTGDAVYGTPDNPFVLNFNVGGVETLTVYPNPVVDELNVAGKLDGEGDVTLELFDVVGAILYEKQVSASDNVLDESVNVTGLVPGSYMLKVTQGDESKVFKVVKK